ncbi:hypothetical protein WJX84_004603 [Apatococcus fuscideae]|uniref:Uncharacterized protein n=1 Tax=Apatococcus fuscideae TaxID=2026836 RepID=A0AAW1SKC0_9CHLO
MVVRRQQMQGVWLQCCLLETVLVSLAAAQTAAFRPENTHPVTLASGACANVTTSSSASPEVQSIAVVGNGPLSAADVAAADAHDLVVRFNTLDNIDTHEPRTRVDIWMMRYAWETRLHYWGLTKLYNLSDTPVASNVKGVFLVGGSPLFMDYVRLMVPLLADKPLHFLPLELYAWKAIYGRNASRDAVTTGLAGILTTLTCARHNTSIGIYGMNWSPDLWRRHQGGLEKKWVRRLQKHGRLHVHETECDDLRSCQAFSGKDAHLGKKFAGLASKFHKKRLHRPDLESSFR